MQGWYTLADTWPGLVLLGVFSVLTWLCVLARPSRTGSTDPHR
jgi:hypothetical protein